MEYVIQSSVTASASCTQIPVGVQNVPPVCAVGSYQSYAAGGMRAYCSKCLLNTLIEHTDRRYNNCQG